MLRNSVFKVRNVEVWQRCPAMRLICWCSGIAYSAPKRSQMCSAVPQGSWFVDAQESRTQFEKRSDMGIAVMKVLRFCDTKESCFETWKRSHMCFASLLCGRFADFRKCVLNVKNDQIWTVLNCKWVYLRIVRNGILRPRNVYIRAVPSIKMVDLLMLKNRNVNFETFK